VIRSAFVLAPLLAADSAAAGADDLDGSYQSLQKAVCKKILDWSRNWLLKRWRSGAFPMIWRIFSR